MNRREMQFDLRMDEMQVRDVIVAVIAEIQVWNL